VLYCAIALRHCRLCSEARIAQGITSAPAQACGRIVTGDTTYDLDIVGMLQRCTGSMSPDTEQVFERISLESRSPSRSILGFSCDAEPTDPEDLIISLADWRVLPLAIRVDPHPVSRWRYWQTMRGVWLPSPFLTDGTSSVKCMSDSVNVLDAGGDPRYVAVLDRLPQRTDSEYATATHRRVSDDQAICA
jgi:hypothetical protein